MRAKKRRLQVCKCAAHSRQILRLERIGKNHGGYIRRQRSRGRNFNRQRALKGPGRGRAFAQ